MAKSGTHMALTGTLGPTPPQDPVETPAGMALPQKPVSCPLEPLRGFVHLPTSAALLKTLHERHQRKIGALQETYCGLKQFCNLRAQTALGNKCPLLLRHQFQWGTGLETQRAGSGQKEALISPHTQPQLCTALERGCKAGDDSNTNTLSTHKQEGRELQSVCTRETKAHPKGNSCACHPD